MTRIGSGYLTRTDPAALVVGPTGLAYDSKRNFSTSPRRVTTRSSRFRTRLRNQCAGMGRVVYQDNAHLRGPLGLVLAPNGDLITSNGDAVNPNSDPTQRAGRIYARGKFVGQFSIDPTEGAAFGLAVSNVGGVLRLAAVEDVTNSLDVWTFKHEVPGLLSQKRRLWQSACRVGRELRHDYRHIFGLSRPRHPPPRSL